METAAASAPPADPPIGANAIGCRTENNSVNAVHNAITIITESAKLSRPIPAHNLLGGHYLVPVNVGTYRGITDTLMMLMAGPDQVAGQPELVQFTAETSTYVEAEAGQW